MGQLKKLPKPHVAISFISWLVQSILGMSSNKVHWKSSEIWTEGLNKFVTLNTCIEVYEIFERNTFYDPTQKIFSFKNNIICTYIDWYGALSWWAAAGTKCVCVSQFSLSLHSALTRLRLIHLFPFILFLSPFFPVESFSGRSQTQPN